MTVHDAKPLVSTSRRRDVRRPDGPFLAVMLVLIVVLQRFAFSSGGNSVPLVLPVVLVCLGIGFYLRILELDPRRARLTLLLWIAALTCAIAQIATGVLPSLLSLGLLALLYVPLAFKSREGSRATDLAVKAFLGVMTGAAVVSLAQFGLQYVGVPNVDWLGAVVPQQLLVQGFSQNAPIHYGEALRRSNAILFLEPSFLSLYLGLAVLLAVRRGTGWIRPLVLLAGMVPTLAGNGLVILIPGLLITLISHRRRNLLALVPGLATAVVAAAATPLGQLYLSRTGETSSEGSSSSLRFVLPYTTLLPAAFDGPFHALFGHGSGSSDDFLNGLGLSLVTRATIPKTLFEYGVVGLVGILGIIVTVMAIGLRRRLWLVGLPLAYLFLNASLLQGELIFFTLFWLILLPPPPADEPSHHLDPITEEQKT